MMRSLLMGLLVLAAPLAAQPHGQDASGLGTVRFETSCRATTRATFTRGVAQLHSFGFGDAIRAFTEVLAADSTCVIAHWGIALSAWGNPFAAGIKPDVQLARGLAAVERARAIKGGTARERAYVDAVAHLYDSYKTTDQPTRVAAYRDAMADLAAKYPNDDEASIFYAAVLAFSADPNDKTYANPLKAAGILERLVKRMPDHPGIAHYLIHAYDFPPLASKGLSAANRYATIAPSAAHALHMPSHTYTRVGKWQESIETNLHSAKVAEEEKSIGEALHANDYLMYAYLQTGQDSAASRVLAALPSLAARFDPTVVTAGAPPAAGFFAIAAIPARYALERGDWQGAAKLEVHQSAFPFTDAITWYAKGIGAARSGDTLTSVEAVRQLQRLRDALAGKGETYWAEQVEIQRRGVGAWVLWARGGKDEAVAEMRATAELEAKTDKNAITPGPIVPARELLAEMLLASGDAVGASRELETTLAVEPDRFRTLAGAMRAAEVARDTASVRRYATRLAQVAARGDRPGRPELATARRVAGR
jgi:hypothetical protein